ncbi:MAG TPA: membrane protein insertion efficiency factor YidD [Coleofasciculaceae cyanobacterium]|jgi:putative component of membrane protein insertase Oxa1/YidC/SpoIIIJ protein YidD
MIRPATFNSFNTGTPATPAGARLSAGINPGTASSNDSNASNLSQRAKHWSNPNPDSGSPYRYQPVPLDNASWLQKKCVAMIEWYQRNSLIHGPAYKFINLKCPYGEHGYSSCSQLAKEAIIKYGVIKGIWRGSLRLLNCRPSTAKKLDHGEPVRYMVA